jgi:diguanylate cyclase (GGDEF)-like protein/PAS domain S-box-containing protein
MKLDISTVAFVTSLLFAAQSLAVFVQYRVDRSYRGLGWWFAGTLSQALGFMLMLALGMKAVWLLAVFANPLIFLGQLFLGVGIGKFLGEEGRARWPIPVFAAFLILYYAFILLDNSIYWRTLVVLGTAGALSLKIAVSILRAEKRRFEGSAAFAASAFLASGLCELAMTVVTALLPPLGSYGDFYVVPIRAVSFLIPLVGSSLWTFGFIIMVNQRLYAAAAEEKEKLLMVFNTSPDANLITRLEDGRLVDVNEGFLALTGRLRGEVIGATALGIGIWDKDADREGYVARLRERGLVENAEYVFRRRDGGSYSGLISGRVLSIGGEAHVVSVIRDVTEREEARRKIEELVRQLEIEKRAAELSAVTDSLTGLANRRCFDECLRREFLRLKRSGAPLSLVILDVDHFKEYNDAYGHLAGDECLRRLGAELRTIVGRMHDTAARYGGEEFVVVMPETDASGAATMARRIREGVEAMAIPHSASDAAPCVTVSVGVVTVRPAEMPEPELIFAMADEALYAAKRAGRNAIRTADPASSLGT